MWMGAVEKDMLLILYIMSITQVARRGDIVRSQFKLGYIS